MNEYTLTAEPALDRYKKTFQGVTLEELSDLAIVSIAVPSGGLDALSKSLQDVFGVVLPKTGEVTHSECGQTRFLGMASDQIFAIFNHPEPDAVEVISEKLRQSGYYTLQSDNWVALNLSGPKSRLSLERICPIDLNPAVFAEGRVARTVMEHMGVVILPDGKESFLLLSTSSSAVSFLHAVETSIRNVV